MAFISLLDDRAKPKGSRDPLGFELVWSFFGRKVVGNLTTITSSLENFAVALLGFYWANELTANISKEQRAKAVRETFLRYEQLAGYLRYYTHSSSIMGITRITERVKDASSTLSLGVGSNAQILSDQASYGLWGLYSSAMRDTGLIKGNERELTEKGVEIAKMLESKLDKPGLVNLLLKTMEVKKSDIEKLAKNYSEAILDSDMIKILAESLMIGSANTPLQREIWENPRII